MKRLLLCLTLLSICGCQSPNSPKTSNNLASGQFNNTSEACPEKPEVVLKSKGVKSITLSDRTIAESGIASKNQSIGYTFEAQEGQKLIYQTKEDICIWVYTPDNQLLDSGVLPKTGKYTIQVSALKGSTTFELAMGLDVVRSSPTAIDNSSVSPSLTSRADPSPQPQSQASDRPSPTQTVIDHYVGINNRRYSNTWSQLSADFKSLSQSYSDYTQWWDSVREVKIGAVRLVEQSDSQAIVNAELQYIMYTGNSSNDSRTRIYLVWDDKSGKWLFHKKIKP